MFRVKGIVHAGGKKHLQYGPYLEDPEFPHAAKVYSALRLPATLKHGNDKLDAFVSKGWVDDKTKDLWVEIDVFLRDSIGRETARMVKMKLLRAFSVELKEVKSVFAPFIGTGINEFELGGVSLVEEGGDHDAKIKAWEEFDHQGVQIASAIVASRALAHTENPTPTTVPPLPISTSAAGTMSTSTPAPAPTTAPTQPVASEDAVLKDAVALAVNELTTTTPAPTTTTAAAPATQQQDPEYAEFLEFKKRKTQETVDQQKKAAELAEQQEKILEEDRKRTFMGLAKGLQQHAESGILAKLNAEEPAVTARIKRNDEIFQKLRGLKDPAELSSLSLTPKQMEDLLSIMTRAGEVSKAMESTKFAEEAAERKKMQAHIEVVEKELADERTRNAAAIKKHVEEAVKRMKTGSDLTPGMSGVPMHMPSEIMAERAPTTTTTTTNGTMTSVPANMFSSAPTSSSSASAASGESFASYINQFTTQVKIPSNINAGAAPLAQQQQPTQLLTQEQVERLTTSNRIDPNLSLPPLNECKNMLGGMKNLVDRGYMPPEVAAAALRSFLHTPVVTESGGSWVVPNRTRDAYERMGIHVPEVVTPQHLTRALNPNQQPTGKRSRSSE
jgi:hypothetical protein